MDEPLDAFLDLHEGPVVGHRGHPAGDLLAYGIAIFKTLPGIGGELLEAQGYLLGDGIELQHLDPDFLAGQDLVLGILELAPGHVGDVQQAVYATDIHESAIAHDVLDPAGYHVTLCQRREQVLLVLLPLLFKNLPVADHHIVLLPVELDDGYVDLLADHVLEIGFAHGTDRGLGTRQECRKTDVHDEPALDPFRDLAPEIGVFLRCLDDVVPDLEFLRLFLAEPDDTLGGVHALDQDLDLLAYRTGNGTVFADELTDGGLPVYLSSDVDHDVVGSDLDDRA